MKTFTSFICALLCTNILFSQKIIDVTERSITVDALKTEELYFGFAAGDDIVFNFSERDKKKLREVEILEYPYNSKFAAFETGKVQNKTLHVTTTSVYRFRFYNDARSARACNIKIQRIPASEETRAFNTNVAWHNQYDTSYYTVQEQYVKQYYVSQQIISSGATYVGGSNSLSPQTKSRVVFPLQLPEHTVEWYYRVSVLQDNGEEINNSSNLAGELSSLIEERGGLQFGPGQLSLLPGEAYCDVYVMDSEAATRFEAGDDYKYSLIGSSRQIKSGITKVYGGSSIPLYLGINNPDSGNGFKVSLECVAIVLNEEKQVRTIEKRNVAHRLVPLLNTDNNISWAY